MTAKKAASPNINTPEDGYFTDIIKAAQDGNLDDVEKALEENPLCINTQDSTGLTALHWAAGNRDLLICKRLLSQEQEEANLWLEDIRGRKAIDHAIGSGSKQIIQLLREKMYSEYFAE